MALQLTITLPSGIIVPNAYVKIVGYQGDKNQCQLRLAAFKDQASMQAGAPQIDGYNRTEVFVPTLSATAGDFITQGYNYIKTLPDFNGATDVLET
ncbi:hypothetical protein OYT88_06345 [Sporolactobacillus sp. CQH2019]|uniref:hypothetical protein n=1 Tax=Sporolactobacillus sp. CQH2019 TaxID=3023512 RepID=UPI0023688F65|nr:hypothetical protein [Sporolactobacillus sp. CQH2019]MDD9148166.1 hypothetical protein [Sporolactobacillus sp. CQH2019]